MADLAVTGSTGALGGRVAKALADLGIEQRLIVRSAERAPRLDGAEVREVPGGYADPAGFREALEGVGTLFLVSAEEAPDRVAQHRAAIEAAAEAGVERIVYTSFLGAAADSTFLLGRDHWATEAGDPRGGRRLHLPARLLLHGLHPLLRRARADLPRAGRGRAPLAGLARRRRRGRGRRCSRRPGAHDGKAYGLTGPELFTLTEAAERLGAYTGEPYSYVEETTEEAWESRRPSGAPDWMIEGWISTYVAIAEGSLDRVSGDVEAVTGRAAA